MYNKHCQSVIEAVMSLPHDYLPRTIVTSPFSAAASEEVGGGIWALDQVTTTQVTPGLLAIGAAIAEYCVVVVVGRSYVLRYQTVNTTV